MLTSLAQALGGVLVSQVDVGPDTHLFKSFACDGENEITDGSEEEHITFELTSGPADEPPIERLRLVIGADFLYSHVIFSNYN